VRLWQLSLNRLSGFSIGVLLSCLLTGCCTEKLLWQSEEAEPSWRRAGQHLVDGERIYVGIGTARNVLDEAGGRRRAIADAARCVSESLETHVISAIQDTTTQTGAVNEASARVEQYIKDELLTHSEAFVRTLRATDWYYEKWQVRPSFLTPAFIRHKYFVRAAYPDREYQRVIRAVIASWGNRLDELLRNVRRALDEGDLKTARELAQRATLHHPGAPTAWWAAYRTCTAASDWPAAVAVLRKIVGSPSVARELPMAYQALTETQDEWALQIGRRAHAQGQAGKTEQALKEYELAWRTAASHGFRYRLSREYYALVASSAAGAVAREPTGIKWRTVAVAAFSGSAHHSVAEAAALREAVAVRLREMPGLRLVVLEIPQPAAKALSGGTWRDHAKLVEELQSDGIDAVVLGRLDEEISLRCFDTRLRQTSLLASARSLGAIQGRPDLPIWEEIEKLLPRNSAAAFPVSVWTPKPAYRVGEDVEIHFKAGRNSHVYVVDVQPSGGVCLLFPNAHHTVSAVTAGQEHVVPAQGAAYAIRVGGPAGWEGLKIVASSVPLDLGTCVRDAPGIKQDGQVLFVERLAEGIRRLRPQDWAENTWAFFVVAER